jgi:hypothetical protein
MTTRKDRTDRRASLDAIDAALTHAAEIEATAPPSWFDSFAAGRAAVPDPLPGWAGVVDIMSAAERETDDERRAAVAVTVRDGREDRGPTS